MNFLLSGNVKVTSSLVVSIGRGKYDALVASFSAGAESVACASGSILLLIRWPRMNFRKAFGRLDKDSGTGSV